MNWAEFELFDRHRNLKVYEIRDYMLWNIYIDDVVNFRISKGSLESGYTCSKCLF